MPHELVERRGRLGVGAALDLPVAVSLPRSVWPAGWQARFRVESPSGPALEAGTEGLLEMDDVARTVRVRLLEVTAVGGTLLGLDPVPPRP